MPTILPVASHDVFHLAADGADIVLRHAAGAEHEFKPSRPPSFGADFAAAEKIAFGHHTDQLPFRIDHRQAADAIAQHCARGLQNRRLCCNGNDIRSHDVADLHGFLRPSSFTFQIV